MRVLVGTDSQETGRLSWNVARGVNLEPDITLNELQGWLLKTFGISSSIGELWNTLKELGLRLSKHWQSDINGP